MTPEQIENVLCDSFSDLNVKQQWGETSFFVNPGNQLPSGAYFATLKTGDGPNDKASNMDRSDVFRFNLGLERAAFVEAFGQTPKRPAKGGIVAGPWDFTALDAPMPHPVYGWMGWVCVLNPSEETFANLGPWIANAYEKARKGVMKRIASQS